MCIRDSGKGITAKIYKQLLASGVDMITMGNHTFSKNDILHFIQDADRLVRPANLEPTQYGYLSLIHIYLHIGIAFREVDNFSILHISIIHL